MATAQPMNLLRAMDHSWNGQWYNSDQVPLDNSFGSLDVEELTQQFNYPPQQANVPRNTFGTFQQDFRAATSAADFAPIPVRSLPGHAIGVPTGFNAAYPPNTVFTPLGHNAPEYSFHGGPSQGDGRGFSPGSSIPATPQASPSSIIPSQQFQPLEKALKPTAQRHSESLKRSQNEGRVSSSDSLPKRRRSHDATRRAAIATEDSHVAGLSDDEKLLMELKEEKNMPWKDISKEFEERLQRPYQVPALQMRYKRLKERLRKWTNEDVTALEAAHEFWESNKYEIIANKMLEFGVHDKWPAKLVERKCLQMQMGDERDSEATLETPQQIPFRVPASELNAGTELRALERPELGTSPTPSKSDF